MPNIPPLISHTPDAQALYGPAASEGLLCGLATNISWVAVGGTSQYQGTIIVPGASASTVVVATPSSIVEADIAVRLLFAYGSTVSGGKIIFHISGLLTSPATYNINWYVPQL